MGQKCVGANTTYRKEGEAQMWVAFFRSRQSLVGRSLGRTAKLVRCEDWRGKIAFFTSDDPQP
jgi:hypothetical protein